MKPWKTSPDRASILLAAALLLAPALACKGRSQEPGTGASSRDARPAEILSWRHQMLAKERYAQLAGEWESYSRNHPEDVRALIEWGDALRYSGGRDAAIEKYRRAYESGKDDPAAIAAFMASEVANRGAELDWAHSHQELLRAARLDPDLPDTYYTLWLTSLHERDPKSAAVSLRRVVEL